MTVRSKLLWTSLIILAIIPVKLSAQGNLGQSGLNFLQIPAEARGAALGGGGLACASGAQAIFWNPAAMTYAEGIEAAFSHTNWFVDTRLTYAAAMMPLSASNAIGLSATVFGTDPLEITTEAEPGGTGETYDAGDLAAGLSFARRMTDRFSFGISGKLVQENIWNSTTSQVAIDIGSRYGTDFRNLVLAMAVRNIGGKLEFSGDDVDNRLAVEEARGEASNPRLERLTPGLRLPQVFQVGIAFDALRNDHLVWQVMLDAEVPSDNTERVILATEVEFNHLLFLRGAYREGFDVGSLNLGAGVRLQLGGQSLSLDYAVMFSEHFGALNTIGIGIGL